MLSLSSFHLLKDICFSIVGERYNPPYPDSKFIDSWLRTGFALSYSHPGIDDRWSMVDDRMALILIGV